MASSFTTNLQFEKQATGDHKAVWGQRANNIFEMAEDAISGYAQVAMTDTNMTLAQTNDGNYYDARNAMLEFTGTLTVDRTITFPSVSKIYIIKNSTAGGKNIIIKVASSTYTLANGQARFFYTNGSTIWTNENLVSLSGAANRFGVSPSVDVSGNMDIGSGIDFHTSNIDGSDYAVRLSASGTTGLLLTPSAGTPGVVWHQGNDGPTSGMDADSVDGLHASEGVWMPVLSFGGNSVGIVYSFRGGNYTKIGKTVIFSLTVNLSSKGSSAGGAAITLPVNASPQGACAVYCQFMATSVTGPVGFLQSGLVNLYITTPTGVNGMTDVYFANNSGITISGTYQAAS